MNSFRLDFLPRGKNDSYFARIRSKDAHDKIITEAMRSENPERIGMRAGKKTVQFIRRQTGHGERFHDYST